MILFSLAGIPPLAGFFAKFYVFLAAIQAGLYALAVIGVVASVVGAYYYLRIVKIMYFDEPAGAFEPLPAELGAVLGVSGVLMLGFVVSPRRWSRRPAPPRTVCSRMAFALGPKALAAGYRLAAYDTIGSTSTRGAGLGDARRSRPALGRRRRADRRPRPARPAVADAARQSRGKPAPRPAERERRLGHARLRRRAGARKRYPSRAPRSPCSRRSTAPPESGVGSR